MPIVDPSTGAVTFLISDLATEVILKVENRQRDLTRTYVWLKEAILEISGNTDFRDDFDQLEVTGPLYNLDALTPTIEYAEELLIPEGAVNLATLDISLWTDYPTNKVRKQLRSINYQVADRSSSLSTPASWYRFGGFIGFSPGPDKNYQVQARVLQEHPINESNLGTTPILLPKDWNEILILSAAMRGFIELMEYEKATQIRQLLYGDAKHPDQPGMIYGRKKRRQREAWRQTQALRPKIRGYGWGSY